MIRVASPRVVRPTGVCLDFFRVRTARMSPFTSAAPWHFFQAHLLEAFRHLDATGLYRSDLQIAFHGRDVPFRSWRVTMLDFYLAMFTTRPRVARFCARAPSGNHSRLPPGWLALELPAWTTHVNRSDDVAEFAHAANSSLAQACTRLPALHRAALAVRRARPRRSRPMRVVLLERRHAGNLTMTNQPEVARALQRLLSLNGAELQVRRLEEMTPLQQVDLLLETDVLVSFHGSGIGIAHTWMPPDSVLVEATPNNFACECRCHSSDQSTAARGARLLHASSSTKKLTATRLTRGLARAQTACSRSARARVVRRGSKHRTRERH